MKFLCDSCKAKYQIADEKVAGKTVRMKCRKCGHQIEVRAAVTETSVASPPPRAPSGAPPRPPAKGGLATSLSATKPRAPSPSTAPSSALAGAFKSNVQDAPASVDGETQSASIELSVSDEWYVAINGVPVGPVRISELRRKAAAGAVTEESLCWQEGLEEWRPIRSIPELAAIVREAAQGNRPSLLSTPGDLPPVAPRPPSTPRQPAASVAPPPPAPRPVAPLTGRSNVVPLRPAASASVDEVPLTPIGNIGGAGSATALAPSLTPAPSLFSAPSPLAAPAPTVAADPFAIPPPAAPASTAPVPFTDSAGPPSIAQPYAPQKRGVPLWFWPIALVAVSFGITLAVFVSRPQPSPAPVVIQMPTPTTQPTATERVDVPTPTAAVEPSATVTSEPKGKTGPVAAKGPVAKAPDVPEKKGGIDLGNLVPGGGGPNVGPTSPGSGPGGGLDGAGVERVVASHRNGVKRTCWERGGADQKSSVNVTITANVAPNGSVASTSSSGDDPVVAKCIESQVKTWQFPAPGGNTNTTINIPFKFVRQ